MLELVSSKELKSKFGQKKNKRKTSNKAANANQSDYDWSDKSSMQWDSSDSSDESERQRKREEAMQDEGVADWTLEREEIKFSFKKQ